MKTVIAVLQSDSGHTPIYLSATLLRIGRDPQHNEICLPVDDALVSRQHARLAHQHGRWMLEDHSRNGSLVNDRRVHNKRVSLKSGDRIRIGVTFAYRFHDPASAGIATTIIEDETTPPVSAVNAAPPVKSRGLWLNTNGEVWRDGARLPVSLSAIERRLLQYLFEYKGRLIDYPHVMQAVWGFECERANVHELIKRLRKKIEPDPAHPRFLHTQSGTGVFLAADG